MAKVVVILACHVFPNSGLPHIEGPPSSTIHPE